MRRGIAYSPVVVKEGMIFSIQMLCYEAIQAPASSGKRTGVLLEGLTKTKLSGHKKQVFKKKGYSGSERDEMLYCQL